MMNHPIDNAEDINNQRISQRLDNQEQAVLKHGKESFPVELLDLGVAGFGLNSLIAITIGNQVELEVCSDLGLDIYRCKVVFCRQEDQHYHIGLEIIEQEPDLIFMTPEEEEEFQLEI